MPQEIGGKVDMKYKKNFEELVKPFCLQKPKDVIGARKCGRECCGNCRTCVYHRPHRNDRLCVFRECPFVPGLSTSTYSKRMENRKRDRRRKTK